MEDALNSLERNLGDFTDTFRSILQNPESRFDVVRQAINPIAMATYKPQVMANTIHIGKYIRLITIIAEQKSHMDHINPEEWAVLAQFLVEGYNHLRDAANGIGFIKATNDVFRALALLLNARASIKKSSLRDIISTCEDFLDKVGQRETSCHPFIMTCLCIVSELGDEKAMEIGEQMFNLGKVRSPKLCYEMYVFACLKPQPFADLLLNNPRLIESHEIEFIAAPSFGFELFRPSGEADLTKFIAAKALSLSFKVEPEEDSTSEPPPKRAKKQYNGYSTALRFMAKAFAGGVKDEYEHVMAWLTIGEYGSRSSSSRHSSAELLNGSSVRLDRYSHTSTSVSGDSSLLPDSDDSISSISSGTGYSQSSELGAAKFWAFILLSQSVGYMNKQQLLSLWNVCIESLQHPGSCSGACFCLSYLTRELTKPANINSSIVNRVKLLLGTLGNSSYPSLTSGSLVLYSSLFNVKILDDGFQKFKFGQLHSWIQQRVPDASPRLVTHFIDENCPPTYLKSDETEDLKRVTSFLQVHAIQINIDTKSSSSSSESTQLTGTSKKTRSVYAPLLTTIPRYQCKTLTDSLWMLAILAKTGSKVENLPLQQVDAFTEEDLCAFVWFANLATFLQWDNKYCECALSLAVWDLPARTYSSVAAALSLLHKPGPVVSAVITGYISPHFAFEKKSSNELRTIEPFLRSYSFQRAPWFLKNIVNVLDYYVFCGTKEMQQLSKFILKVVLSQSEFSLLRTAIGTSGILHTKELIDVIKTTSELQILQILTNSSAKLEFTASNIAELPQSVRLKGTILLASRKSISLAQTLLALAEQHVDQLTLKSIARILGFNENIEEMLSASAVPLWFTGEQVDYRAILTQLGGTNNLIKRFDMFMVPFNKVIPGRNDGFIMGIIEQVMRECSYCGSDTERMKCIEKVYVFIQAHFSSIPDIVLVGFFQSAFALLGSENIDQKGSATSNYLISLVEKLIQRKTGFKLLSCIAPNLYIRGKQKLSLEMLSRMEIISSPLAKIVKSFTELKITTFPNILTDCIERKDEMSNEMWKMLIMIAISIVEKCGVISAFESCSNLPSSSIQLLISWTNYLKLPHNTQWLALVARLAAKKKLFMSEIDMNRVNYSGLTSYNIQPVGADTFYDILLKTYNTLPCEKKWKLNPFLQRIPHIKLDTPMEIFGERNWTNEIKYRPGLLKREIDFNTIVDEIAETALKLVGLPSMGPYIFEEIPELLDDVLPYLVSFCYNDSLHSVPLRLSNSNLKEKLDEAIRSTLVKSGAHRNIGLRIIERCYQQCQKVPVSANEIVQACKKVLDSRNASRFVELGILFVELIWNEDPNAPLPQEISDCLYCFYSKLPDKAFEYGYKSQNQKYLGLLQSIKMSEGASNWQKLEFDMVDDEAQALSDDSQPSILARSFQSAGLWHLANKVASDRSYYDLERVWWLREWDTVQVPNSDVFSKTYEKPEYGALIGFFTKELSTDETYAKLAQTNIHMASVLDDILKVPITSEGSQISDLQLDEDDAVAIAQHGRETLLTINRNTMGLANELKSGCHYYRRIGDINRSLGFAIKLEHLASSYIGNDISDLIARKLNSLSCIETAKTEWELGQQSTAIASLQWLLKYNHDNQLYDNSFDLADIYSTLGSWLRYARHEPDDVILNSNFIKASEIASEHNMERIFHAFAHFCDAACNDKALTNAILDSERVKANEKRQVDYLSQVIQSGNANKEFQSKFRVALRMFKAETEDCEELKKRKFDLTVRCIQNYLLSMQYGDTYEEDMGRFIALWLSLWDNKEINKMVYDHFSSDNTVPLRKFLPWMNQLTSRLGNEDSNYFQKALMSIVQGVTMNHPYNSVYYLINIIRTRRNANKTAIERKSAARVVFNNCAVNNSQLLLNMAEFADKMAGLATEKLTSDSKKISLRSLGSGESHWWTHKLPGLKLPVPTAPIPIHSDRDNSDKGMPYITSVKPDIDIAGGISSPKIITLIDSHGETHKMVLKGSEKDDLRQDAIMQQVFEMASQLLSQRKHKNHTRRQTLRVRTYNVIPLGGVSGAIGFVRHTKSLQEILEPLHTLYGGKQEYSIRKARHAMYAKRDSNRAVRISTFEQVMEHTKPQMRHFWTKQFRDPHDWFEAKTAWCRSTAVTSILGHVVGLGDRHCSNLLVDTNTGEVVHIDLGIAFDQGKQLYIPETVPFRLTRDMVDGMGVNGTAGVYTSAAETTLQVLRDQRDRIMTVLEVLKHDTLYTWSLPSVRLSKIQVGESNHADNVIPEPPKAETGQAEHALRGVKQKLADNLSCEAMVRDLVAQARDTNNLALIFSGWSPFY